MTNLPTNIVHGGDDFALGLAEFLPELLMLKELMYGIHRMLQGCYGLVRVKKKGKGSPDASRHVNLGQPDQLPHCGRGRDGAGQRHQRVPAPRVP